MERAPLALKLAKFGTPGAILLLGLWLVHAPTILPPWDGVPGNYGDARFTALLLEHAYGFCFQGWPTTFWDLPWNFHPYPNTLAFAEVMAGGLPFYAPFRWLGFEIDSAYQGWVVTMSIANFVAAYALARQLGMTRLAASTAAWLFAFSMIRNAKLGHAQLLPHFLTVTAASAWLRYVAADRPRARAGWLLAASLAIAWQFWACVYLGLFAVLAGLGYGLALACLPGLRATAIRRVKQDAASLALAVAAAGLALWPLIRHYTAAQSVTGYREWRELLLVRPLYLVNPPEGSWLYGGLARALHDTQPFLDNIETYCFAGFVPLIAVGIALHLARTGRLRLHGPDPGTRIAVIAIVLATLVLSTLSVGGHSPWQFFHAWIPGMGSMRAVARVHLLVTLLSGLCLAAVITHLQLTRDRLGLALGVGLLFGVVLENGLSNDDYFSKREHRTRAAAFERMIAGEDCDVFFIEPDDVYWISHLDAAWLSMQTRIPTINGYSGWDPQDWPFREARDMSLAELTTWLAANGGGDAHSICLLHPATGQLERSDRG